MSSRRKIAANRANARLSTGPQTVAGKQQTRYNATRHGLSGKQVVVDGEDPSRYEALRKDLMGAYQPANAAESLLVEEIAQSFWRLQRARAIEVETFNLSGNGSDPVIAFERGHLEFERIRRYMTTIERAYHRAIDQLQETQKSRAKLEAAIPTQPSAIAATPDGLVSQPSQTQPLEQVRHDEGSAAGDQNVTPASSRKQGNDPLHNQAAMKAA